MQLQSLALRQLFSLCSCTCPSFPGILLGMHLQLSKFWELFLLCSCSFGALLNYFRISHLGEGVLEQICISWLLGH